MVEILEPIITPISVLVKKKHRDTNDPGTKYVIVLFCGIDGGNQHTADSDAVVQIHFNDFFW